MSKFSVGIDIIDIQELEKKMKRSALFLDTMLSMQERADQKIESIAGKIAVKEAIIKTGYLGIGQWKRIEVGSDPSGRPVVMSSNGEEIISLHVSISHTKHTAVAVALYEKD